MDGITNSVDMSLSKFWEMVKDREAWCGVSKNRTRLSNLTTPTGMNSETLGKYEDNGMRHNFFRNFSALQLPKPCKAHSCSPEAPLNTPCALMCLLKLQTYKGKA